VDDDELVAAMMRPLEIDFQVTDHFEEWDTEGIAQFRRCGRRAIRKLGYKAHTFQTDPAKRDDRRVIVYVMVTNRTEDDEARLAERSWFLIQNMPSPFDERTDP
jgi:hypothetical protein